MIPQKSMVPWKRNTSGRIMVINIGLLIISVSMYSHEVRCPHFLTGRQLAAV